MSENWLLAPVPSENANYIVLQIDNGGDVIHERPRALCREVATRITSMTDWIFAQEDPSEELAKLHLFAIKKHEPGGNVEFTITVHEYVQRNALNMRFFAQADKQINQNGAPFTPFGWGETLLEALSECVHVIRQYPYQGEISGA